MRTSSLSNMIKRTINRKKSNVIMRKDLEKLGGYDQVGRGLRKLVEKKELIRLGYGVYTKTRTSPLTGHVIPSAPIDQIGKEVLKKLNKKVSPSPLEKAYNEGRSEQIPTGSLFFVKGRISRKLSYQGKNIRFAAFK